MIGNIFLTGMTSDERALAVAAAAQAKANAAQPAVVETTWTAGSGGVNEVQGLRNYTTANIREMPETQWNSARSTNGILSKSATRNTINQVTGDGADMSRTWAITGPGPSGGVILNDSVPTIRSGSEFQLHIPAARIRGASRRNAIYIFLYVDPSKQVNNRGNRSSRTSWSYYRMFLTLNTRRFGSPYGSNQNDIEADPSAFFDTAGRVETCTDNGDGSVAITVSLTALVDIAPGAAAFAIGTVDEADTVDLLDGMVTIDAPTPIVSAPRGTSQASGLEVADATADGHRSSLPAVLQFVAAKPSGAMTVASITGTTGGVAGTLVADLVVESDGALRLDVSEDGGATTVSATAPAGVWATTSEREVKIEVAAAPAEVWVYLDGMSLLWVPLAAAPSAIDSYLIGAPQPTAPADADGRGTAGRAGSICKAAETAAIEAIRVSIHDLREVN